MTEPKKSVVPANAKKPQDHQESAPPDRGYMVDFNDHKYLIDPARMNDMRFMEWLSEMDGDKPYYISKVVKHILGDQWQQWLVDQEDDSGLVPAERAGEFFSKVNEAGNS